MMTESEILEEQQKLLGSLDPSLIQFLASRRNQPPKSSDGENLANQSDEKTDDVIMDTEDGAVKSEIQQGIWF